MVALSAHQNALGRHSPVEVLIEGVHVRGPMTVCRNTITSTAIKLPASVLIAVAVVAAHSCDHVLCWTLKEDHLIEVIDVTCPETTSTLAIGDLTAKVPNPVLIVIVVLAGYGGY